MGTNNNTTFPCLGSLRGKFLISLGKFFFLSFFFQIFFICQTYILHFSKEVMSKLILVWCLFGTAVLAKPSRSRDDLDDGSCDAIPGKCLISVLGNEMKDCPRSITAPYASTPGLADEQFVCERGVGYYCHLSTCQRTCQKPSRTQCTGFCAIELERFGFVWSEVYPKMA